MKTRFLWSKKLRDRRNMATGSIRFDSLVAVALAAVNCLQLALEPLPVDPNQNDSEQGISWRSFNVDNPESPYPHSHWKKLHLPFGETNVAQPHCHKSIARPPNQKSTIKSSRHPCSNVRSGLASDMLAGKKTH